MQENFFLTNEIIEGHIHTDQSDHKEEKLGQVTRAEEKLEVEKQC